MELLFAHCAATFSGNPGLFAAFFLGGLTGGFTHCLSMCGPMVACQSMCASKKCDKAAILERAGGLHYHLGRLTSYGALGFIVAYFSRHISAYAYWAEVSSVMLAIAGAMFIISSLPGCKHALLHISEKLAYTRGALTGFMPCGLLYAALMMAATLADPLSGMVAMWLFVLGTIPALLIASAGAEMLTKKWQNIMHQAGRALMAFNGLSLLVMAARVVR